MQGSWRRAGVAALVSIAAALLAAPASAARPNFVVIVTDDQTLESFNETVMPKTFAKVVGRGTTFSQAIVSTPQCCPSRAGFLTGQYAHNNGVNSNRPGYSLLRRKRSVLPVWLRGAGYRTIHLGKYLNGYFAARGFEPAPGWDRWQTLTDADYQSPVWSIGGEPRADTDRYLTRTLNKMAVRAITKNAKRRRPFYLQVDHLAPHVGSGKEVGRCEGAAIPGPGDEALFADAKAPRNPASEESDLGDKPEYLSRRPPPKPERIAEADRRYGCALASLRATDRGISAVVGALRRSGELGRTMIVFTSDNGYSYLEHRALLTKGLPYEEHLRVPLVIRPPRGSRLKAGASGMVSDAPVANIDLAPTILQLAKARSCRGNGRDCRRMDGRSLLPLLRGRDRRWTKDRAVRASFAINQDNHGNSCEWVGLRTPATMLVRHTILPAPGGTECTPAEEHELYDLSRDPFQLKSAGAVPAELLARLDSLSRCSGIRGRDTARRNRPFCE